MCERSDCNPSTCPAMAHRQAKVTRATKLARDARVKVLRAAKSRRMVAAPSHVAHSRTYRESGRPVISASSWRNWDGAE